MTLKKILSVIGVTIFGATLSLQVNATNLRFALGFPSGSPIDSAKEYSKFIKEKSDGEFNIKVYEMSLLSLGEMSEGVTKGLADIGYVMNGYFPSDYPHSNLAGDMHMLTSLDDRIYDQEGYAYAGAMLEYIMLNCPECQQEHLDNNQVYTGTVATTRYIMFCNDPVDSIDKIKGKRVRIAGAPWARWVKHFDASPVSLTLGEAYEALNQGVIDCTFSSANELTNFNLIEVVKHIVTDLPGGLFASGGSATMNKTRWDQLSEENKKLFLEAGAVMTSEQVYRYQELADIDLEKSKDKGINILEGEKDFLKESHRFVKQDINYIPEYYSKEYKIKLDRATELADTMEELVEKWIQIIADADIQSASDLKDIYWDEVYSKIDVSSYGQ